MERKIEDMKVCEMLQSALDRMIQAKEQTEEAVVKLERIKENIKKKLEEPDLSTTEAKFEEFIVPLTNDITEAEEVLEEATTETQEAGFDLALEDENEEDESEEDDDEDEDEGEGSDEEDDDESSEEGE